MIAHLNRRRTYTIETDARYAAHGHIANKSKLSANHYILVEYPAFIRKNPRVRSLYSSRRRQHLRKSNNNINLWIIDLYGTLYTLSLNTKQVFNNQTRQRGGGERYRQWQ